MMVGLGREIRFRYILDLMLFNEATFIGVDPTAGKEPFVYAAIDHRLRLGMPGLARVIGHAEPRRG